MGWGQGQRVFLGSVLKQHIASIPMKLKRDLDGICSRYITLNEREPALLHSYPFCVFYKFTMKTWTVYPKRHLFSAHELLP